MYFVGFVLYWCYIASLLCYSYACLYYHACLHYVNKKWSDKDTDCTCCVHCILKCLHSWNHKNLSFPWIYDMVNLFFCFFFVWRLYPVTTRRPAVPPAVRWILNTFRLDIFVLYLIIAGLRHILSLHFTVLINSDEYWISFLRVGWINTHSHLV